MPNRISLVPVPWQVAVGQLVAVNGTFIGAILPGAVELIKCSFADLRPSEALLSSAAPANAAARRRLFRTLTARPYPPPCY
jgi:hypothetical protein